MSGIDNRYVQFFDGGIAPEHDLLGGKCASLVTMTAAGMPVPPGFAVTTATYDEFVEHLNAMCDKFVPTTTIVYATAYLRQGVPGPKWMPAPAWRIVSAPINGALRLVFIGSLPQQMRDVCRLEWTPKQQRRFDRFAAFMRTANPVINRLPLRMLYTSWAYDGWKREGVDPRKLHNG